MRIISQDGKVDLPYELVSISTHARNSWQVIARPLTNVDGLFCVMGEYSTEEKAVKAMEELRAEYGGYRVVRGKTFYSAFDYPKVFRFPQDSEV
jgi:hypothetical protein